MNMFWQHQPPPLPQQPLLVQPQQQLLQSHANSPPPNGAHNWIKGSGGGMRTDAEGGEVASKVQNNNTKFIVKKKRVAVECVGTSGRINITKNALRKDLDNFCCNNTKNTIFSYGPRRAGVNITTSEGYIALFAATGTTLAVGNSIEACETYINWIRKKVRGLAMSSYSGGHAGNIDSGPPSTIADQKVVNLGVFLEPAILDVEIRVGELQLFLRHHFPHWDIMYNPELSPYLTFRRRPENLLQHDRHPVTLAPHMLDQLTPLEFAVYELLLKESSEELYLSQMMLKSVSAMHGNYNAQLQLESELFDVWSGHRAIFLVASRHMIIHGLKEESELNAALADIMPIVNCFITNSNGNLSTVIDMLIGRKMID